MANLHERNELLTDVVLYLQTVLVTESLSERAEMQRQQLLEKISNRETSSVRAPYMDMNGRSKGLLTKSNSFACLHQQAAYEELFSNQPIYNNVPYEDDILNYEPFVSNGYSPSKHVLNVKRHSAPNGGDNTSSIGSLNRSVLNGSSLSSRSNSDTSECSKSDVIYVSANAVKYSASKYGVLMKREKILFVDHTKKYWSAVLSSTMYVYNGEKDLKPCSVIHLEGYAAREANATNGNRNKDWMFEIVCPGKKSYQFIAQTQKDMLSWIEAINNSSSKPSSPDIILSPSPICFKQELLPNRELPVPPADDEITKDYCYDKPNPIIRPVNLYENAADEVDMMESIYHFIDESKSGKDVSQKCDEQLPDEEDSSYYNIPNNIPVVVPPLPVKEDRNNNDCDGYFTEKEISYDIISNEECEMTENAVLGVQQIIQKIEGINSKKTTAFLKQKSPLKNNSLIRNSAPPVYTTDEFYEPMQVMKNMPKSVVVGTQSFRKSR